MNFHSDPFLFCTKRDAAQYTESETKARKGAEDVRDGWCHFLGLCAFALGVGILIAAIFPVGALLFLVAFLLIGCGCACMRR